VEARKWINLCGYRVPELVGATIERKVVQIADRDNAPMESFFHTLKTELVMHCDYKTRDQARASLFDYMEVFYNRQRRHLTLTTRPRWPSRRCKSPNQRVH
jgi:transposase InsO family protein